MKGFASLRTPFAIADRVSEESSTPIPTARWVVVVGAAALPLVVSPVTADAYFLPKLVAARLVVITLLVIMVLAAMRGRLRLRRTPLDIPLAIFVVSALASTIPSANANLALFGSYGRYEGFLTILLYALLFWLAVQSLEGAQAATLVLRTLLGVGFVVSVLSILQVALGSLVGPGPADTGFSSGAFLRGYATFGNPNALGAFLAMLLPVAVWELLAARSATGRLFAANVVAALALGLVLTFSRSAWIGAAIGVAAILLVAARLGWATLASIARLRWAALAVFTLVVLFATGTLLARPAGGSTIINAAASRLHSIEAPLGTSSGQFRLRVWRDTIALIASRPFFGYGPDTFGLVYPRFETGSFAPGTIVDRPHSEPLGVAATQGVIGLAAYVVLLVAVVKAFWTRRRQLQSVALFGGIAAYIIYTAFNFSYLPVTLPFWIFTAAAITVWQPGEWIELHLSTRFAARLVAVVLVLVGLAAAGPMVIAPYQADSAYSAALSAAARGQRQEARALVDRARTLAPWQSTYAVAAGSLALDLGPDGRPAPDAEWGPARAAFLTATRLGSFNAAAYRYLAIADVALGRHQEAIAAARIAVQLNRFDPANQAELASLLSGKV